jgi:dTDP-4-dehydrorhamnose reductase
MIPWLVTGAGGQLGSVVLRQLTELGIAAVGTVSPSGPRPERGRTVPLDLLDTAQVERLVETLAPERIVHCAALTQVAACFRDPVQAERINVETTRTLARLSERRFVLLSTDMVFDGERAPYPERAEPQPTTVYGRTKLAAETVALATAPRCTAVVRVPLLYGIPSVQRPTTFLALADAVRARKPVNLFADEVRTPLWLEDAARAVRQVADSPLLGTVHTGGPEPLTRLQMGQRLAAALGIEDPALVAGSQRAAGDPEPRPRDLSLVSQRFREHFGVAPGLCMADALALTFGR